MFTKPFTRVEQSLIDDCYLNVGNGWLIKFLPKMKTFKINFRHTTFRSLENAYFSHHFKHLEHFKIRSKFFCFGQQNLNPNEFHQL